MNATIKVTTKRNRRRACLAIASVKMGKVETAVLKYAITEFDAAKQALAEAMTGMFSPRTSTRRTPRRRTVCSA